MLIILPIYIIHMNTSPGNANKSNPKLRLIILATIIMSIAAAFEYIVLRFGSVSGRGLPFIELIFLLIFAVIFVFGIKVFIQSFTRTQAGHKKSVLIHYLGPRRIIAFRIVSILVIIAAVLLELLFSYHAMYKSRYGLSIWQLILLYLPIVIIFIGFSSFKRSLVSTSENDKNNLESGNEIQIEKNKWNTNISTALLILLAGGVVIFGGSFLMAELFDNFNEPDRFIVKGEEEFGLLLGAVTPLFVLFYLKYAKYKNELLRSPECQVALSILISVGVIWVGIIGFNEGYKVFKLLVPIVMLLPMLYAWER